jgi:hypothetical protein
MNPCSVLVQFLGKNSVQGLASLPMAVPESASSSLTIVLFYTAFIHVYKIVEFIHSAHF